MPLTFRRKSAVSVQSNSAISTIGAVGRNSRWGNFFISWAILSLVAAVWSLATPISAAPDEPAHIIKAAAVARGQFLGANTDAGQQVTVPAYVADTAARTCFAYNNGVTADCVVPITGSAGRLVTSSTSAGLYNPTYYFLVGWPSLLFHDDTGIYAMRFVSGLVSSLFLAAALMMLTTWRRRTLPIFGFAVAVTPMVFFLNGVVNPNSLETTATLGAFVGVLSIVLHPAKSLVTERSVIVLISAAIAVNARGLSPLWVAIAVLIPFVLARSQQIRELIKLVAVRIAVIGVAVSAVAALLWIGLSNSLGAGISTPGHLISGPGVGGTPLRGFAQILAGTFDYGQGIVGIFGWLDSAVPPMVLFTWSAFIGGVVLAGFVFLRDRPLVFALSLVGGLIFLPPITQALYVTGGGIVWQGRYALPLFVCVIVGISAVLVDRVPKIEPSAVSRFIAAFATLWFVGQVYAFVYTLKRYSVGTAAGASGASWKRLFFDPNWDPPGGTIWICLAYAVISAAMAGLLFRRAKLNSRIDVLSPAPERLPV